MTTLFEKLSKRGGSHWKELQKSWKTQPRHPAGTKEGGQWLGAKGGGPAGFVPLKGVANLTPDQRLADMLRTGARRTVSTPADDKELEELGIKKPNSAETKSPRASDFETTDGGLISPIDTVKILNTRKEVAAKAKEIEAKAKQLVDKADVYIAVQPNTLGKILEDGRFKSQIETGTSGGFVTRDFGTTLRRKSSERTWSMAIFPKAVWPARSASATRRMAILRSTLTEYTSTAPRA